MIVLMLHVNSPAIFAAQEKSWFEEGCSVVIFHIIEMGGPTAGQELDLTLRENPSFLDGLTGSGIWVDVDSKQCPKVGSCEYPLHAKLRLDKMKARGRRISGKYSLDFYGGTHLEGQFEAKYRPPKTMILCE